MNIKSLSFWFAILALFFVTQASANVSLKGLATLEKLNKPIYLAGVSGEPPTSVESFNNNPTPFSMHAKYVIEKFSARRNSQLWLNAFLVSSSREEIGQMESAVLTLKKIVRTEMHSGDELVFEINPSINTRIKLNNIELAIIDAPAFQKALVKYWFGERLASKKFAKEIRETPKGSQLELYHKLSAPKSRQQIAKDLKSSLTAASSLADNSGSESTPLQSAESKGSNKVKSPNSSPLKVAKKTSQSSSKKKVSKKQTNKKYSNKNSKSSDSKKSKDSSTSSTKNKKVQAPQTSKKTSEQTSQSQVKNNHKSTQSDLVDSLYATLISDYTNELVEYIEHNARPTPPMKVRRKPKGEALLSVNFSVNQNKMLADKIELIEGSFDELLVKAFEESITRLKRIPVAPEAIQAKHFKIQVKLDFNKCKRSTSAWICF